jgi:hypothetical protein
MDGTPSISLCRVMTVENFILMFFKIILRFLVFSMPSLTHRTQHRRKIENGSRGTTARQGSLSRARDANEVNEVARV